MINIINDNFNDLAKDYYKLQEDYEKQSKEIERLNKILSIVAVGIIKSKNEKIEQLNNIIENVKDTISFICYNSERPLTMKELNKLYNLLDGASKK